MVKQALLDLHYSEVYLDVDSLQGGNIRERLTQDLQRFQAFVAILTPGCYDRCFTEKNDVVLMEIETALRSGMVVVPVIHPAYFKAQESCLSDYAKNEVVMDALQLKSPNAGVKDAIMGVVARKGVVYNHAFQEGWVSFLHSLLQGWKIGKS